MLILLGAMFATALAYALVKYLVTTRRENRENLVLWEKYKWPCKDLYTLQEEEFLDGRRQYVATPKWHQSYHINSENGLFWSSGPCYERGYLVTHDLREAQIYLGGYFRHVEANTCIRKEDVVA
jgi:hypothetical protein